LLEVGFGKLTIEQFCKVIEAKDRNAAGASVPAKGLFLVDISYPEALEEGLIRPGKLLK
jgi:tRNA pseudouridine38-40 synthase